MVTGLTGNFINFHSTVHATIHPVHIRILLYNELLIIIALLLFLWIQQNLRCLRLNCLNLLLYGTSHHGLRLHTVVKLLAGLTHEIVGADVLGMPEDSVIIVFTHLVSKAIGWLNNGSSLVFNWRKH